MAAGQQNRLPPSPRFQQNLQELQDLLAKQRALLESYAWVSKERASLASPLHAMKMVRRARRADSRGARSEDDPSAEGAECWVRAFRGLGIRSAGLQASLLPNPPAAEVPPQSATSASTSISTRCCRSMLSSPTSRVARCRLATTSANDPSRSRSFITGVRCSACRASAASPLPSASCRKIPATTSRSSA